MEPTIPLFGNPVMITTADDMATLLQSACPEGAAAFATAAHERACWGYDEGRVTFWEHVVDALTRRGALAEAAE